jgi:hypothetical protein
MNVDQVRNHKDNSDEKRSELVFVAVDFFKPVAREQGNLNPAFASQSGTAARWRRWPTCRILNQEISTGSLSLKKNEPA